MMGPRLEPEECEDGSWDDEDSNPEEDADTKADAELSDWEVERDMDLIEEEP